MRLDANLANGGPTLAALIPNGVTLAHILALFQTAYPVNGEQLVRQRLSALGTSHPASLALPGLTEFIKYLLAALKSAGIKDPAALLAHEVQREAEAAAAKLKPSLEIGDIAAQSKSAGPSPVEPENDPARTSTASLPRSMAQALSYGTTKVEDERQPNPALQTIGNPEATNPATTAAGDEIVIEDRRLLGERRVAEMLGRGLRTLQRWRKKGKGPPSTKIGRTIYYEVNDLQEWIDRGKTR